MRVGRKATGLAGEIHELPNWASQFSETAGLPLFGGSAVLRWKGYTMIEGIEWGTNITDLPDMILMGGIGGGKRIYARKGERKKIGDADVEAVLYGCYKDRLEAVQIHFRHSRNFAKLKEMLFRIYGPGQRPVRSMETYHWYGKQVSVFFAYNQVLEKGAIGYTFMPIYREEREDGKRAHKKRMEMAEYFKNLKTYAPRLVGSGIEGKRIIPEWGL